MDALEPYLVELSANRLAGAVPETSGYGALAALLNEVGRHLKPKARCVINPANRGAGIPDGGFFIASQFEKGAAEPLPGQLPARGGLEVKGVAEDAHSVALRALCDDPEEQLRRYLEKYHQVLVTTYRQFVLVGYDAEGQPALLESYSLADTETGFWLVASTPRKAADRHGERLAEFLKRCLLRQTQIAAPQELAWFLASYAREARARTEERDLPALATTRAALEEALGMSFTGEKGEHFFRSTLVQTLFYGLFAAWVFWAEHHEPADKQARFRWREAAGDLHIPILQRLFYDFANPAQLGALKLDEVLDWAAEALNRVDRASFFSTFEQSHAVQYFYEPFLEAFDPELRKELGVWYTPPEIVQYMVARVDQVLRSELGLADGLADPRVVVLDPCCGTGAYLVEVLNTIAASMHERGDDALLAHDLKQAAMSRIYGFEILPAPFVISHLQIGMLLHRLGAPFDDDSNERAGVYLTNALTGWDPPTEPKQHLLFPEMEDERDKAEAVKQHAPILVILGNPPYNAYAGVSPDEEGGLVEPYKEGLAEKWGINKNYLDDLYIRFYRVAERRIGEDAAGGVVCFISNFSWLADPSAVVMRERMLAEFGAIWIDCLNGDSRETGKRTPDGLPDPSVFSTLANRAGIQVGTAVGLLVRDSKGRGTVAWHRNLWGVDKLARLAEEATSPAAGVYETLAPTSANRYRLRPEQIGSAYSSWPTVAELSAVSWLLGLNENRGGALIDTERAALEARMRQYLDGAVSLESLPPELARLKRSWARFDPAQTRDRLLRDSPFDPERVRPFLAKPFDLQWAYVDVTRKLWNEPRPALVRQMASGQLFLLARCRAPRSMDGQPFAVSRSIADQHALHKDAYLIPFFLLPEPSDESALFTSSEAEVQPNLSSAAAAYLASLHVDPGDSIWLHALSTGYSRQFLEENADGIRLDWPRIPLPATADALLASAQLGRRVASLLDVESPVDGVSFGQLRFELCPIGSIATADGGQIDPAAGDLAVTAGWGHAGRGGICMPAKGHLTERPYTEAERAGFREGLADLGLTYEQLMACLGGTCVDVFLNERAYWRCVPMGVWRYTIGGYQVMKKWLSYRERPLLGRDLTAEEARYVTEMARRIAALLLLEPALDANYARVKGDTYEWATQEPGP